MWPSSRTRLQLSITGEATNDGDASDGSPRSIDRSLQSMKMELRQLEIFLAVAEELHFGRAARRVHLSQPALTQAVARFEQQLNAKLFERSSRLVELTPAGAALVDRARSLLSDAEMAGELVARTARGELGIVRLGVVGTALLGILPSLVRSINAEHPGLELVLAELTGMAQVADLRAGRLDLGILHADESNRPVGVELLPLVSEPLSVALPSDHRLAHRSVLRLVELRDDSLVVLRREREADTHGLYLGACAEAGFAPQVGQLVTGLQALLGFVAAGLGWAFVPASVVSGLTRDGVTYVRLRGTSTHLPTALAWPAGVLPPSAALVRSAALRLTETALAHPGGLET